MDPQLAEAIIREKRARLGWVQQVRAIVELGHEITLFPYDRVRVDLLQQIVAENLGQNINNALVRRSIDQALQALGLDRRRVHGRPRYRGVRPRPE
jgi:hypothetical protein